MAASKLSFETVFLREFSQAYVSEISFTETALEDIRRHRSNGCRAGLADVLYVLRNGDVTGSEKEESEGAKWHVEGVTCHGDPITVSIQVWCDRYQVRVLRVMLMGVSNA